NGEVSEHHSHLAMSSRRVGSVAERLTKADPNNAGWQRDLSVPYEKVGDVLVAQGGLTGALKSYGDSLAIRDRLTKADPNNAGWQYDLGISNERIGDVQIAQGDVAAALKSYEARRNIISGLAKLDFVQFMRPGQAHPPCDSRFGLEFLCYLGAAGT